MYAESPKLDLMSNLALSRDCFREVRPSFNRVPQALSEKVYATFRAYLHWPESLSGRTKLGGFYSLL